MTKAVNKTALVLAGGGIMGAAYEIGCLSALDRLFAPGFSTRHFDMYIGVSAGSVIATLMANRIAPEALFRAIATNDSTVFNWRRKDIYRMDKREILHSTWDVLHNLFRIFRFHRKNRWGFNLQESLQILQEQFPAGLFSLEPMQHYLCESFRKEGIIDDFDQLKTELYIPAYDLDLGTRVVFGTEGNREMAICQAITASCAIPFFFRPLQIGDHFYLDGSVGRVSHIDIALEQGAKLIVVVNPRVPMNNDLESACLPSLSYGKCSSIAHLGINFAWEQARRIENKEKLDLALEKYSRDNPDTTILLIEPGREESVLFFQNPMSNLARHHIMDYGYHLTLSQIQKHYDEFRAGFSRHGINTTTKHLHSAPPVDIVS